MAKRDLRAELDGEDTPRPPAFRFEVGDRLVGRLVRLEKAATKYGTRFIAILEREEDDQEVAVWLYHTVLLDLYRRESPKPGDRLGIRRLSDHQKGYARYRLVVDRADDDGDNDGGGTDDVG